MLVIRAHRIDEVQCKSNLAVTLSTRNNNHISPDYKAVFDIAVGFDHYFTGTHNTIVTLTVNHIINIDISDLNYFKRLYQSC